MEGRACAARQPYRAAAAAAARPAADEAKPHLGFLGLGIMGDAMAGRLLAAGYPLTVWNRSADKCEPLVQAGAQLGESPQAVAEQCDIVFAMLADPAAARDVALGPRGVTAGLAPGKGYVDVSTVDAGTAQEIAAGVRAAGGRYLEAPVSGSKGPAQAGQLIFLAAGDRDLFDAASPALAAMGKASFFLGEVGAGANMKLVVNMVMGTMMASFAEGLQLARAAGLASQDLLDVLALGAIACPMYALKGPAMVEGSYPPAFPLRHQAKDLRLALALAAAGGQALPVAASAAEQYARAQAAGLSDADFSAVLEAVCGQQANGTS